MPDDIRESGAEKRLEHRVAAALPVTLEGAGGVNTVTRDVSASGLFFETDAVLAPGAMINLVMELETPGGKRVFHCQGSVLRVEAAANRIGCAVKILESRLVRPD